MNTNNARRRLTLIATVTAALCLASAGSALAGKPQGGGGGKPKPGGGTIKLAPISSPDGLPHYGGTVSFEISTNATSEPWVNLRCYQRRELLAEGWNGYFEGSLTGTSFGLYSPKWSGGAADCTAYLTTPQWAQLASTSFHVYD